MANLEVPSYFDHSRLSSSERTLTELPTFRPNSEKPNHNLQFVETAVNSNYNKDLESSPLVDNNEPPVRNTGMGNPAIVGNWAFGTIFLFMGLYKLILPEHSGHMMLPVALFFGGCTQFLSGLLCLIRGSSWGASLFMTYGAYWIGSGIMMIPSIGSALDIYDDPGTLDAANGIYFFMWSVYALMVTLISLRIKGGCMVATYNLFFIFLNLLFEGIYNVSHSSGAMRTSGAASLFACVGAYYLSAVDLFAEQGKELWVGRYRFNDDM